MRVAGGVVLAAVLAAVVVVNSTPADAQRGGWTRGARNSGCTGAALQPTLKACITRASTRHGVNAATQWCSENWSRCASARANRK